MYIRFKKNVDGLVQITDIPNGIPIPHTYFKFTEENLPEASLQWFEYLNSCIFTVIEIVGDSPKFEKYKKYLQDHVDPVIEQKRQEVTIKHIQKQVQDKKEELVKKIEEKKVEAQKKKGRPSKQTKVITDTKEIEDRVKKFLS